MKTALVAGSTGLVGSQLLKLLESEQVYDKIHVLVRKSISPDPPIIMEHVVDFDRLDEFDPGDSIDHVFCCLGTTIKKAGSKENFRKVDFEYVVELGKKAKEWQADKFLVVTALGSNPNSSIFYNKVKGEVEAALLDLDLKQLFVLRPSLLMGDRKENRAGEKTAITIYKVINPLFIGRLKKYKGIEASQVARALMVTALEYNNTHQIIESDELQDL